MKWVSSSLGYQMLKFVCSSASMKLILPAPLLNAQTKCIFIWDQFFDNKMFLAHPPLHQRQAAADCFTHVMCAFLFIIFFESSYLAAVFGCFDALWFWMNSGEIFSWCHGSYRVFATILDRARSVRQAENMQFFRVIRGCCLHPALDLTWRERNVEYLIFDLCDDR